jgi:hypothetical protein
MSVAFALRRCIRRFGVRSSWARSPIEQRNEMLQCDVYFHSAPRGMDLLLSEDYLFVVTSQIL